MRRLSRFGRSRARKRLVVGITIVIGAALVAPGPAAYAGPANAPTCLNPTTDVIAKLLAADFGCTNRSHFATIFSQFRKELGG